MTPRRRLKALAAAALFGVANAAAAAEFPAPQPYAAHAEGITLADYRARTVGSGVRLLWDGEKFTDADGQHYTPPQWFREDFPTTTMDGRMVAEYLDDNAIGRIMRAGDAADGWQRLAFVALDLPEASGGLDERREALQGIVREAGLPKLSAVSWRTFADAAALQTALDAMYKEGGDGYILQHKDADYDADDSELLLVLPYELGEATVLAHRAGKGDLVGMMGSLEVQDDGGGEFIIGIGFSREVRRNPPKIGARIAYRYKGFTATGKPKNPVFLHPLTTTAAEKKIGGIIQTTHLTWLFIVLMTILAVMDAASHRPGGRRWNFKSAIVSTGLLGTFVGIFWGLYNFDTTDITASVPALLEGLKLSFITSIAGITLSTTLSIVQTLMGSAD